MPAVVNNANINIQPANIFFMITSSKRGAEVGNSGPAYKQFRGMGRACQGTTVTIFRLLKWADFHGPPTGSVGAYLLSRFH